jgi:hypothetical protein
MQEYRGGSWVRFERMKDTENILLSGDSTGVCMKDRKLQESAVQSRKSDRIENPSVQLPVCSQKIGE